MISDFEAYLLTRMRATDRIAAVLNGANCSLRECEAKARRAATRWRLDETIHSADAYRDAMGDPASERLLHDQETVSSFVGSLRVLYDLPLWPKVWLQVHKHPHGYAWGVGFVQKATAFSLSELSGVEPWEWTAPALESRASQIVVLDHWDDRKDLRLIFEGLGGRSAYVAEFDFGLLQSWRPAPIRNRVDR